MALLGDRPNITDTGKGHWATAKMPGLTVNTSFFFFFSSIFLNNIMLLKSEITVAGECSIHSKQTNSALLLLFQFQLPTPGMNKTLEKKTAVGQRGSM